jgi:hypothetical protein
MKDLGPAQGLQQLTEKGVVVHSAFVKMDGLWALLTVTKKQVMLGIMTRL